MKIKNAKDFWSGLIFISFGLFFFLTACNYEMGTAKRMGPGYFPTILGGLIVALGLIVFLRSLVLSGEDVTSISLRPLFIPISLILFGYIVRPFGLVLSLAILVFISAPVVGYEFRLKEVFFLSVALIVLSVLVFNMVLRLYLPIWPGIVS